MLLKCLMLVLKICWCPANGLFVPCNDVSLVSVAHELCRKLFTSVQTPCHDVSSRNFQRRLIPSSMGMHSAASTLNDSVGGNLWQAAADAADLYVNTEV